MSHTYSKATSDVTKTLIVLALCGADGLVPGSAETLTDFVGQALASRWRAETRGSGMTKAGGALLSPSSLRSVAERCLTKLSECKDGTNKFVRLLIECFDSRWPEGVAFARLQ